MTPTDVQKMLRLWRAARAIRRGRFGAYARRSIVATLVGKATGRWGR